MTGRKRLTCSLLLGLLAAITTQAAQYTVGKTDPAANFKSIQAAVDKAGPDDEIIITDLGVYEEQVTIDSTKSRLILRSYNITGAVKPVIRFKDTEHVHPKNYAETKNSATIDYNQNGALRIIGARGVSVEGIIIDGNGKAPFAYPAVWGGIQPLFHGNAAVVLCKAEGVMLRHCEMRNAYYGIYCHDRNEGGVFAYAADPEVFPEIVVPFSGFAATGNHLVEQNRICNNTWGIYFESLWDIGSTVRNNLLYDNHHENDAVADQVSSLPGGIEQAGGAVVFKDVPFTPVAIYNNTFYHNNLLFAGLNGAGAQHLVFNNIYGPPYRLWSKDPVFRNPPQALDAAFVNRMYNCVYSCQAEAPETTTVVVADSVFDSAAKSYVQFDTLVSALSRVRIMNGMEQVKTGMTVTITVHLSTKDTVVTRTLPNVIAPGNLITAGNTIKPFPESSNVRWCDVAFLSTDPSNASFLEPVWTDANVKAFVVDKGWSASGVKDPDGSSADIGMIPNGRRQFTAIATVRPTVPVVINGTTATISFSIMPRDNDLKNPRIVYAALVKNLDTAVAPGSSALSISTTNIIIITPPKDVLKVGSNTIKVTVPASVGPFASFELIIESEDVANSRPFTAAVGFIPYRGYDYILSAVIQDTAKTKTLTEVRVGEPVNIHIEALSAGNVMTNTIKPVVLSLGSLNHLVASDGLTVLDTIPGGMISGKVDIVAMFTKIPIGGIDNIMAAGLIEGMAFLGASADVRILPGKPDHVTFWDPPSHMAKFVSKENRTPVFVKVYDQSNNLIVDSSITVTCKSLQKETGDVDGYERKSDPANGTTAFWVTVNKDAQKGDTFVIVATLPGSATSDTVFLIVDGPNAVILNNSFISKPHLYTCELVDLRGRVVMRLPADQDYLTRGSGMQLLAGLPRGVYLERLTEVKTGQIIKGKRMIMRK